jgi:hypothetical protein
MTRKTIPIAIPIAIPTLFPEPCAWLSSGEADFASDVEDGVEVAVC